MTKFKLYLGFAAALIFVTSSGVGYAPGAASKVPETGKQQIAAGYGKLPLTFERNQGQADPQVKFLSRGSGYALFLTPNQAVLSLRRPTSPLRIADCGLRNKKALFRNPKFRGAA